MQPCSFGFFGCSFSGNEFEIQLHERDAVVSHLRLVATSLQTLVTSHANTVSADLALPSVAPMLQSLGNALERSNGVKSSGAAPKSDRETVAVPVAHNSLTESTPPFVETVVPAPQRESSPPQADPVPSFGKQAPRLTRTNSRKRLSNPSLSDGGPTEPESLSPAGTDPSALKKQATYSLVPSVTPEDGPVMKESQDSPLAVKRMSSLVLDQLFGGPSQAQEPLIEQPAVRGKPEKRSKPAQKTEKAKVANATAFKAPPPSQRPASTAVPPLPSFHDKPAVAPPPAPTPVAPKISPQRPTWLVSTQQSDLESPDVAIGTQDHAQVNVQVAVVVQPEKPLTKRSSSAPLTQTKSLPSDEDTIPPSPERWKRPGISKGTEELLKKAKQQAAVGGGVHALVHPSTDGLDRDSIKHPWEDSQDGPAATSSDQEAEIEHWRVKLSDKTVEQLKSLLKLNYMTVTGIKSELVDRAAEAVVKGCVPRCPRCRVPVLRYRDTTGMFYCPGMYSAEKQRMLDCSYKVEPGKMKRFPWKWT